MMRKFFGLALAIGLVAFVIGFWRFAESVRPPENMPPPPEADAIVALTGGSLERLETGVRLLEEKKGERLLISGVNRVVTDAELFHALNAPEELAECCIDLGRGAEDTIGNAAETAAWMRDHEYSRIILVTDDYHMPRSHAELSLAMPDAEIYRYPVRTRWTDPELWRHDWSAARRLGSEYVKYLMFRGREMLIQVSGGSPSERAEDAKAQEET